MLRIGNIFCLTSWSACVKNLEVEFFARNAINGLDDSPQFFPL